MGENVQRRSNGKLELRFPVPADVRDAFLDRNGVPRKMIMKSLGTSDVKAGNVKAEALKTDFRRQFEAVRRAQGPGGVDARMASIYREELQRTQAEIADQHRLRLKASSRSATPADRQALKNWDWEQARLNAYGAALLSDDPEERTAVAGWAAGEHFRATGHHPDPGSPEYRAVVDKFANGLVDVVIAQSAAVRGEPIPPLTSVQIRAASTNVGQASISGAAGPKTSPGQLPLSRYFEKVYVAQSGLTGGRSQGERNIPGKRQSVKLFCELIGDKPLAEVTRTDMYEYVALLRQLPNHRPLPAALKRMRADDLIEHVKSTGEKFELQHANTSNKHSSNVSAVLSYAEKRGDIAPVNVRGVKARVDDADPPGRAFTNKELNRIFSQPLFRGCAGEDAEGGLWKPGSVKIRDDRFWIPLVLLFTGARSSEAVGLLTSEVDIDHEVPHFVIQPNTIRRLKNTHSKRMVPIHPKLIALGFLKFARARRADRGNPQLFQMAVQTQYRDGATGELQNRAISNSLIMRQFNRTILAHADATSNRGSIKCFRNTFEQESLSKIASDEMRQRLTGRRVVSSNRQYVSNIQHDDELNDTLLVRLKIEIEKIEYASVDLSGL